MIETRLLQRIAVCHRADLDAFVPWRAGGEVVGRVHRDRVAAMLAPPSPFRDGPGGIELPGADPEARTSAVAAWCQQLVALGAIRPLTGERYAASGPSLGPVQLLVDRAAVAWLGVRAAGVHLNGYVRGPQGLALWVARRARDKRTFPGHLDNLVAGGQSSDLDAAATLRKECIEEAGLPPELSVLAREMGALHYVQQDGASLKPDTLTVFDLELPDSFRPRPLDGEVESFELWPVPRVLQSLVADEPWKPNCVLVVIDFLLRHGCLDAELSGEARWRLWNALHDAGSGRIA
jgi:8-oxo-dGTP pyrophosphatase MutT (NUDIX family)